MRERRSSHPVAPRLTLLLLLLLLLPTGAMADRDHHRHEPRDGDGQRPPLPWLDQGAPSSYRPLPRIATVITGATILDGRGGRIDAGDVAIDDGRIVAVGQGLPHPAGAAVIDGHGLWLTPGLIDVHTHAGTYTLPQGANDATASDVTETSDPDSAQVWVEHSVHPTDPLFARTLAGGVTTMQILPGSSDVISGRTVVVKPIPAVTVAAMKFPGAPQGLKMACGINPRMQFGAGGKLPNTRMGEIALIRQALINARQYMAAWQHYEADDGHGRPPDRDLKLDTLAALLAGQLRLHIHCYRAEEMAAMIELSHEFGFRIAAFHHATEAYKIAQLLKHEGICVAVWPDWWGFKREAEDGIRENAAFVDAAGGCVTMHSDIPVIGYRLNLEAAKAMAAGRRAGIAIAPEQAIRWITGNPAIALGLDDRIGAVARGMDADLVLWSGDPFSVYSHVEKVFVDGAIAYDRGRSAPPSDFMLGQPAAAPLR